MLQDSLVLLLILVLGWIGRNPMIAMAAGLLLIIQVTNLHGLLPLLGRYGVPLGIMFMVVGVLVPFANGRLGLGDVGRTFTSTPGIMSIAAGALAAYLSGRGVMLLDVQPQVIVGLILGILAGIFLLKGVPVGPLVAAGLAAVLIGLSESLK